MKIKSISNLIAAFGFCLVSTAVFAAPSCPKTDNSGPSCGVMLPSVCVILNGKLYKSEAISSKKTKCFYNGEQWWFGPGGSFKSDYNLNYTKIITN